MKKNCPTLPFLLLCFGVVTCAVAGPEAPGLMEIYHDRGKTGFVETLTLLTALAGDYPISNFPQNGIAIKRHAKMISGALSRIPEANAPSPWQPVSSSLSLTEAGSHPFPGSGEIVLIIAAASRKIRKGTNTLPEYRVTSGRIVDIVDPAAQKSGANPNIVSIALDDPVGTTIQFDLTQPFDLYRMSNNTLQHNTRMERALSPFRALKDHDGIALLGRDERERHSIEPSRKGRLFKTIKPTNPVGEKFLDWIDSTGSFEHPTFQANSFMRSPGTFIVGVGRAVVNGSDAPPTDPVEIFRGSPSSVTDFSTTTSRATMDRPLTVWVDVRGSGLKGFHTFASLVRVAIPESQEAISREAERGRSITFALPSSLRETETIRIAQPVSPITTAKLGPEFDHRVSESLRLAIDRPNETSVGTFRDLAWDNGSEGFDRAFKQAESMYAGEARLNKRGNLIRLISEVFLGTSPAAGAFALTQKKAKTFLVQQYLDPSELPEVAAEIVGTLEQNSFARSMLTSATLVKMLLRGAELHKDHPAISESLLRLASSSSVIKPPQSSMDRAAFLRSFATRIKRHAGEERGDTGTPHPGSLAARPRGTERPKKRG